VAKMLVVRTRLNHDGTEASVTFDCGTFAPITWKILPETRMSVRFSEDISANFALLAALPFALRLGVPLHVKGDICRELLGNVENLIRFRALQNPSRASRIEVNCSGTYTRRTTPLNTEQPYLIALSGGIDSTYALATNWDNENKHLRRNLVAGLTIRGFDFPLGDSPGFEKMVERITTLSLHHRIEPIFIETNWKSIAQHADVHWGTYHIIALAALLYLFERQFGGAIIASDFSYRQDQKMLQWGSNSIANAMLSSSIFRIEARGADVGRTQKVRRLCSSGLFDNLMVCWEGPRDGKNCGRCTKCLRAMLAAYSQKCQLPGPFPRAPTVADALSVSLDGDLARLFTSDVLEHWSRQDGLLIRSVLLWRLRLASLSDALRETSDHCRELSDFLGEPSDQTRLEEVLSRAHSGTAPDRERLKWTIDHKPAELSNAREDLSRASRQVMRLEASLDVMKKSASWRVTSFLRRIGKFLGLRK